MKSQNIDTLQWTPSERLRKVLFIKKKGDTYDKSFAEALTSAKRCYDVRIVEELDGGDTIRISYLQEAGFDDKKGKAYMAFLPSISLNGIGIYRWYEPVEEPVEEDGPLPAIDNEEAE